ncbi:peroxisome biogenesis factor 2-like [Plakobranchus ocellatus]|uniref:Peroxisome biogenesis factor 2 n=1 Tax=Plakobranchus ocellatus TaxID=259542 RepID=A0AAV4CRJ1_9GAST|nr:peroxisome biogenesis factor 2-like [Plakobranchus ocellatus]
MPLLHFADEWEYQMILRQCLTLEFYWRRAQVGEGEEIGTHTSHLFHNKVISGFQALRQARAQVARPEPVTEGSPADLRADSLVTVRPTPLGSDIYRYDDDIDGDEEDDNNYDDNYSDDDDNYSDDDDDDDDNYNDDDDDDDDDDYDAPFPATRPYTLASWTCKGRESRHPKGSSSTRAGVRPRRSVHVCWPMSAGASVDRGLHILHFSLYDTGATVGQQILGIYYGPQSKGDKPTFPSSFGRGGNSGVAGTGRQVGTAITSREKTLYALLMIVCPWLKERISTLLAYLGLSHLDLEVHWWLSQAQTVIKVAALINLFVFLRKGVYLSLVERLLGVRAFFPQRQGLRQVGFEYMTRELLWHGFSEFLFFLLPLINFQRIKNSVRRWLGPRVNKEGSGSSGHLKNRTRADLMACAVCEQWPILPREIGCRHVFCYYCISANVSADPNFCCPQCDQPVGHHTNIHIAASHINPQAQPHIRSS